ncbi:hypothetical protein HMI54_009200 [Coelomomyces lativittatus]|nr:hypothetical protein HMI54_009200 [Coelomomyces lativittatus]
METLNAFLRFLKASIQLYIPVSQQEIIQANDKVYDKVKNMFSNFFETIVEIFEASKNLRLP